jgi:protein-L-isoaspartate(D-aspartate) O-methyltransferase
MVDADLARQGISDERVLAAFRDVAREDFVPKDLAAFAYDNAPLPIGEAQTISQPYIVAVTVAALSLGGGERVLEVGTGSGYAAAILGRIAKEVYTIERIPSFAELARERLSRLGSRNVCVRCGDGSLGWAEHAPFDAIAVAAGCPRVPRALREQLAIGGRLVVPVGASEASQQLMRITRETETEYRQEQLASVRFVPLIGEQGWAEATGWRGAFAKSRRPSTG